VVPKGRRLPPPATPWWKQPRFYAGVAVVAAVVGVVAVLALTGAFSGSGTARGANCPTEQPAALAAGDTRTVTIETAKGSMTLKIDGSLAPIATGNFVALASCGFYDGIGFHRTATMQDGNPFVIQGGDPQGDGRGGPGYTIKDDPVTATYHRGTVAMARGQAANSQGSQFFIVLSDAAAGPLSSANTYAILGEVTSGMEVADAIYQASGGAENPPNPVKMTKVTVTNP